MANVDRPNGFRPVKTISGAPVSSLIRTVGVADGADIFYGDALQLSSGLAQKFATGGTCLGVAIGFGKKDTMSLETYGPFNVADLETRYYDDSANTHTDWVVFYVPANDVIFAAQTDQAVTLVVDEAQDVVDAGGNASTGVSQMEINGGATVNSDLSVVELPNIVNNDLTLANAEYWVKFNTVV